MGALHEFEAPELHKGDAGPHQFDFQDEGVVPGPEEHRYPAQGHTLLQQGLHLGHHQPGLLSFIRRPDKAGPRAVGPAGEQALGVFVPGPGDDGVGQVQDGLGAAVILLQLDDPGAGEQVGKIHDVAEIGATEGIDGLGVVPHRHDVLMGVGQKLHQLGLEPVGVLVFVHHQVAEAVGQAAAHVLVLHQQAPALQQQVVIVQEGVAALFVLVGRGHFGQVFALVQELGVVPGEQEIQGQVLINHRPQNLGHGLLPGKRPGELFKAQALFKQVEEIALVGPVHDRKPLGVAEALAVLAQPEVADAVEGAPHHLAQGLVQQMHRPGQHLPGGLAGEGQQQNSPGVHPLFHQIRQAVDQGAGLAAAGPGNDQDRSLQGSHRLVLGRVELLLIINPVPRRLERFGFEGVGHFLYRFWGSHTKARPLLNTLLSS